MPRWSSTCWTATMRKRKWLLMREPVVLRLEKRPIDLKEYRLRKAQESDYEQLITESTVVVDGPTDRVSIVYLELDDDCTDVVEVIRQVRYDSVAERAGGMLSQSRIFGYRPRITIRDDFCTVSALAHENPLAHGLVSSYAEKVSRYYEQFNPELYTKHAQAVDKVLPDWKIEPSEVTSGIINKNNPLPYHFDAGNFKDVWSNMLVFKQDVQGGKTDRKSTRLNSSHTVISYAVFCLKTNKK